MRLLFVSVFCVLALAPLHAADDFGATQAKALIPEAAGIPADVFQKLGTDPNPTPDKLAAPRGQTLTWWVMTYAPDKNTPKNPTSFRFLGETINVAKIASAISGAKDDEGKYGPTATVIHPEYITDCTCKVAGNTATGVVSFKVEKVYEGKVEYTARKKDGKWRIEEFRLPEFKTTLALGADGKWVKK
jgi:hypothetical protein